MTTVHVVAWRWNDGAGMRWAQDPKWIVKEYESQVACECELFKAHGYRAGLFEVEVPFEIQEGDFGKMAVDMFVSEWLENAGF